MKAGTATKLVLNMLTTAAMVKLGKVHGNLMVDLRAVNDKVRDRSARIVMELTHLSRRQAEALLRRAEGKVKAAIVMHFRQVDLPGALQILDACGQFLRKAIETVGCVPRTASGRRGMVRDTHPTWLPSRARKGRRIIEETISQQLAGSLRGLNGLIVAGAVLLIFIISYVFGRRQRDTEDSSWAAGGCPLWLRACRLLPRRSAA